MREWLKRIPLVGNVLIRAYRLLRRSAGEPSQFEGTQEYWESRYHSGGTSGPGSYGELAEFKANFINDFVKNRGIRDVIEFGCGDGNQLALAEYPAYAGFDVSRTAIDLCQKRFLNDASKVFDVVSGYDGRQADLVLSLDVIYHLVEEATFESYMRMLFSASRQYVIIYSSDSDDNAAYEGTWIRQWKFTEWITAREPGWTLIERVTNPYPLDFEAQTGSWSDFFVYRKTTA